MNRKDYVSKCFRLLFKGEKKRIHFVFFFFFGLKLDCCVFSIIQLLINLNVVNH